SLVIKIRDTDAGAQRFVGIAWPDAAARRPDFYEALLVFAQPVKLFVIRKNKMGSIADKKTALHAETFLLEAFDFLHQRRGIDDNAIADDALGFWVENSRRNQ